MNTKLSNGCLTAFLTFFVWLITISASISLVAMIFGFPIMWLWNWLMPEIFGLPVIDFWQAIGLSVLSGFLVRGFKADTTNLKKQLNANTDDKSGDQSSSK